jgi:hypothetical protein
MLKITFYIPLSFLLFSCLGPFREPKKKRIMLTWKGGKDEDATFA